MLIEPKATTGLVRVAGDTMTGPLVLSGDPTTALQAVTKQYADAVVSTGTGSLTASGGVARVTNDFRLADMPASTLKGNITTGPAAPVDLTAAQVRTLLGVLLADGGTATNLTISTGSIGDAVTVGGAGTLARTLKARFGDVPNIKDYGAVCDGTTSDTAAWNAAIADWNAGTIRGIVGSGVSIIDGTLTTIVAQKGILQGLGGGLTLQRKAGDTSGKFFVLGNDAMQALRVKIKNIELRCVGTPNPNDFAIDAYRATQCSFNEIDVQNLGSIIRYGSAAQKARQCTFRDFRGDCNSGANADSNILVLNGASGRFLDIDVTAGVASNGNPTGAMFRISPPAGALVDTIRLRSVSMQMFSIGYDEGDSGGLTPDGKPYGLVLDETLANIVNVSVDGLCVFDHTTVTSIYAVSSGTSGYNRNWQLKNSRATADAGKIVDIALAGSGVSRSIQFSGWRLSGSGAGPFVDLGGAAVEGCSFTDNKMAFSNTGLAKPVYARINSDGWYVDGNTVFNDVNTVVSVGVAWQVTAASITNLFFGARNTAPGAQTRLSVPVWTTASAPNRIIELTTAQVAAASPFNPATTEWLTYASSVPARSRKFAYDDLVQGLIDDALWPDIALLGVFAASDEGLALHDLRVPSRLFTKAGTSTWVKDRGYTSNGSTGYIDTGYLFTNPNSFTVLVSVLTDVAADNNFDFSAGANLRLATRNVAGNLQARVGNATTLTYVQPDSIGTFAIARTTSTAAAVYADGVSLGTSAVAADAAAPTTTLQVGRSGANYSTRQIGVILAATGWSATQVAAATARIRTFLQAVGAPV